MGFFEPDCDALVYALLAFRSIARLRLDRPGRQNGLDARVAKDWLCRLPRLMQPPLRRELKPLLNAGEEHERRKPRLQVLDWRGPETQGSEVTIVMDGDMQLVDGKIGAHRDDHWDVIAGNSAQQHEPFSARNPHRPTRRHLDMHVTNDDLQVALAAALDEVKIRRMLGQQVARQFLRPRSP